MPELPKQDYIIETERLEKKFGLKTVLRKVDPFLKKGDFLTLFGPNGAGKTTLIHILSSVMLPTSGKACIAGFDTRYEREAICKVIGVISHDTFLYNHLTAYENLKFYGIMYGVLQLNQKIEKSIELVGLSEYMNDRVQTFSRGMQQRLSVARAMIHDPVILFLDEPFTGLDQHGAENLKQILQEFRSQKKTIIMTSHDIDRGLELCNRTAILNSGTFVYEEETPKLSKDNFKQTYLKLTGSKN